VDGRDPFLNEAEKECEHRNEPACSGLQSETNDDDNGNNWIDGGDQTIGANVTSMDAIKQPKTSHLSLFPNLNLVKSRYLATLIIDS
jgi:hypothetical protein